MLKILFGAANFMNVVNALNYDQLDEIYKLYINYFPSTFIRLNHFRPTFVLQSTFVVN